MRGAHEQYGICRDVDRAQAFSRLSQPAVRQGQRSFEEQTPKAMAKEDNGSIKSVRQCALSDELSEESGCKTQKRVNNAGTRP